MAAHRRVTVGLAVALALGASPALAAHTFDLAQHMPPHYAAMFMVNWFGIPQGDPQPGGLDPGYGNWLQTFPNCGLTNDPATCGDFPDAGRQRVVASKRRPLAGIYSSSARDDESKRRIDLVLSCVRRPCDSGARLDSFIVQLDSVEFTSRHPQNRQVPTWDIAYRALVGFLDEADAAALDGAVTVGSDATVYWHFGASVGLATDAERQAALGADIADMATIAAQHPSAARVNGKPLLAFYVDSALVTPATWQTILDGARVASGVDFYAIATTLDDTFFAAFDGLSPWVNLGLWGGATGATTHDRAADYARQMHAKLLAQVGAYPGRVMLGGVAAGFDDYTQNWGACQPREIPRDPAVLQGQMDYLTQLGAGGTYQVKGVVFDTWDDWTEGTEFEPDVVEGTAKLVQARQLLGALYGEAADPAGDNALDARWHGFGQARSCCFETGSCSDAGSPAVDLSCPSDAGSSGDPDAGGNAADGSGGPDASSGGGGGDSGGSSKDAPNGSTSGCGCGVVGPRGALAGGVSSLAVVALVAWRRRARRPAAPRA
jgi:hypothetical protein